ncbi:type VI secretion system accessory protein TagJ [Inquilinus sp.]|jgi:type VI secretion system protein ImpE|uniref:type VI secretion system accessory protein TagJ n=1 Tax=Inquilinus sp. TaxID=1932117 RepID=UPI0037847D10
MTDATAHFQAGQLSEAVAAALAEVKAKPGDTGKRVFLAELLCFAGDFERADRQLDVIGDQDPGAALGLALFRQLIRAAQARAEYFSAGRLPEFLSPPEAHLQKLLEAGIALREGRADEAARLAEEAEAARPPCPGRIDDTEFDDFRDVDDMVAPVFEVLTSTGKYYWVPAERVLAAEFHAPERSRDLLWRRVTMSVADGPDGDVYLPVVYAAPGTAAAGGVEDAARLGRVTEWLGGDGSPARGVGQRCWLAGEIAVPILQARHFAARPAA